ncbi:MAG: carotenoid biosynthesis protein [Candidatus Aminicenantes bacterium]|nr:carotenoid biosynthesis protein [Candidatus Aminicenantes bacterium]
MLLLLELAGIFCGIYILFGSATGTPRPVRSLARAAIVSASAWITEESCILLYGFYDYHPDWCLFLGQVPLLIVVIWPVILLSAMELTSHLRLVHPGKGVFVGAAVVATDALFIEPLCASAGLWNWKLPGLFNVPPIGILGWFFFALLCLRLMGDQRLQGPPSFYDLLLLALPVIGTHLLLLLTWWGALRWINFSLPTPAVVGVAWCVSFFMIVSIQKKQIGRRLKKRTLLLRIPAALFFFALLIVKAPDPLPLAAYALAFVPPYVTLMVQQYRHHAA